MLTPQQVEAQKFVKAVFGGYDMGSVDDFLERLTADYTALYKENAVLKSKLKILVQSVEEYRSVDESMRRALLSAQNMAKETVSDAKKQADEILKNAKTDADAHLENIEKEIAREEQRLNLAKGQTASFIDSLRTLYENQLNQLKNIPDLQLKDLNMAGGDPVGDTAQEIADFVKNSIEDDAQDTLAFDSVTQEGLPEQMELTEAPEQDEPEERDNGPTQQRNGGSQSKIFNINLDVDIPEIRDEDLSTEEDTGPLFTQSKKIDYENLQFGDNYRNE